MVDFQKKTEYILMNKDRGILLFLCLRNEYDEPTFQELQWYVDYRPIGYQTLTGFLERRKAPKHREHIQRLLERFGCDDLEGFLNVTHEIRSDLMNLQGFQFAQHSRITAPQERLEALRKIVNKQIIAVLE